MDRTQYTNLVKAWEFTEEHARERESNALTDARTAADKSGQLQGSAAQARLLGMLVRITGAASVIAVGTGSLVETLQLAHALDNKGLLTAVDSTAQGIALIRKAFVELQDETDTTLRAVNAPASVFLPRLNANDYDLIVVAGDAENYAATFAQASRLLRTHGVIVFTDVLALEDGQGGMINPADRSDKAIAMRELLTTVEDDEGFESTLTPDGTGLLIAYKKYSALGSPRRGEPLYLAYLTIALTATSTASSASSVTVTSFGSIAEIMPCSATGPLSQSKSPCQYSLP